MPRAARLYFPGGVFHIISRFHNRSRLMSTAKRRLQYLRLLERTSKRVDARILGWCLMSTHVHLVVLAGNDRLSKLMKPVHSGFATGLNRNSGRIGPVFADRYKAILVEQEPYLLQLMAYVHNNPVRAGVVETAEQSEWTSHRAYLGLEQPPEWLDTGFVLGHLSRSVGHARRMFGKFVSERAGEERRPDLSDHGGGAARNRVRQIVGDGFRLSDAIVGSEAFADTVIKQMAIGPAEPVVHGRAVKRPHPEVIGPALDDVVAAACAAVGVEPWVFSERRKSPLSVKARQVTTYTWIKQCGGKQVDVARHFKVPSSLVSRWYSRAIDRLPDLEEALETIKVLLEEQGAVLPALARKQNRYSLVVDDDDGVAT